MCDKCDPRPHCLWCGERSARTLPCQILDLPRQPVFCTLFCAGQFAIHYTAGIGVYWCAECQQWHTPRRGCGRVEAVRFTLPGRDQ